MLDDHGKYITTQEFSKLTADNFDAGLKQANLTAKADAADFVEKTDLDNKLKKMNKKVTSNKTKHVLIQNELNDPQDKIQK